MTYRDRGEAELERRRALDAAIAAEPDVDRREAITRELARLDGARRAEARRLLPVLAQARRASPCLEPFEAMRGDDAVRTCTRCDREVFDTARMTIGQTEALVAARGASACTSLRRRSDGTTMFEDCAVGAAGVWTRRAGALAQRERPLRTRARGLATVRRHGAVLLLPGARGATARAERLLISGAKGVRYVRWPIALPGSC